MRYVLCLERLALYFLVFLALLDVHKKLEPSFLCVGEKHAPLHPRTQHRIFMLIFVVCVLYLFVAAVMFSSCAFMFISFQELLISLRLEIS